MAPSILFRSPEPSAKYDALSGELPSDHEDVDTDDELLGEKPRKKLTAIGPMWYSLAHISLLFFLANIVLFGLVTFRLIKPAYSSAANGSGLVFHGQTRYETRRVDDVAALQGNTSELNLEKPGIDFVGPPRPAYYKAWADLMRHQNFRVQEEELGQFAGEKSLVKLSDGSGYYMTMSVFHGLHCIQRLHHYIYHDHYYPNISEAEDFALKAHTDHCLDWLRQYVQCNADTTLVPIRWAADSAGPVSRDWGKRTCVAWDPIADFVRERSFDPFEPGLLRHPTFGNPYAGSKGGSQQHHHVATGVVVSPDGHAKLFGGDERPQDD